MLNLLAAGKLVSASPGKNNKTIKRPWNKFRVTVNHAVGGAGKFRVTGSVMLNLLAVDKFISASYLLLSF